MTSTDHRPGTHGAHGAVEHPDAVPPDSVTLVTDPEVSPTDVLDGWDPSDAELLTHSTGRHQAIDESPSWSRPAPRSRPCRRAPLDARTAASGRRWRKPVIIGAAALVAVLAIAGAVIAGLTKTVTISVDGVPQEVTTMSGSVEGALDAAGLAVGEHDTVAPAADSGTRPTARRSWSSAAGCSP